MKNVGVKISMIFLINFSYLANLDSVCENYVLLSPLKVLSINSFKCIILTCLNSIDLLYQSYFYIYIILLMAKTCGKFQYKKFSCSLQNMLNFFQTVWANNSQILLTLFSNESSSKDTVVLAYVQRR